VLTGQAFTLPFFWQRELQRAVDRWLRYRPPDLVYVYRRRWRSTCSPQGAEEGHAVRRSSTATSGGRSPTPAARWAGGLRPRGEDAARSKPRSRATSTCRCRQPDVEQELFTQHIPGVVPTVLPNGVDVEHFTARASAA